MKILRATKLEAAATLLAKHYPRVLVRATHGLKNPIRLRADKVKAARIYFARPRSRDSQIARWQEHGGILISTLFDYQEGPHDALLLVECPMSIAALSAPLKDTGTVAAIYRSPSWRAHADEIKHRYPAAQVCRRFYAALLETSLSWEPIAKLAQARGHEAIAAALQLPAGLTSCTDDWLAERTGVPYSRLRAVRKPTIRSGVSLGHYFAVQPLLCRVEPRDTKLLAFYRHIADKVPQLGGVRLALNNTLEAGSPTWRIHLHALVKCGSIEKQPKLGFYRVEAITPDFKRIQAKHVEARAKLAAVTAMVDAAPALTTSALARLPRAPQEAAPPSSAPGSPSAVAHSAGTGR